MSAFKHGCTFAGLIIALCLPVHAQVVPLNFGTTNGILNEFNELLPGTASAPGALVQILEARQGVFPPDISGNPHLNNPVLQTTQMGAGTDPTKGALGKVAGSINSLANRSSASNTNTIFARIFNASTLAASSFYTDSQLYDVPVFGDKYGTFYIDAQKTDTPLDVSDNDNDGLHNSWEVSFATDPENPDSDDDGMLDGNEVVAGTDPNDHTSLLVMVELIPAGGGNLEVMWDSVSGKVYQLEYTTNALTDVVAFAPINPQVTATGLTASTIVTNGTVPPAGTSFRVRVVTE